MLGSKLLNIFLARKSPFGSKSKIKSCKINKSKFPCFLVRAVPFPCQRIEAFESCCLHFQPYLETGLPPVHPSEQYNMVHVVYFGVFF